MVHLNNILLERKSKILNMIKVLKPLNKNINTAMIAVNTGMDYNLAKSMLEDLEKLGQVKKEKIGKGYYWELT